LKIQNFLGLICLQRGKLRAMLCYVFWLARHHYHTEARDLVMMSHVSDTIHLSDLSTKILFNRAMAQLGLCAFRLGHIRAAYNSLSDLYSTSQVLYHLFSSFFSCVCLNHVLCVLYLFILQWFNLLFFLCEQTKRLLAQGYSLQRHDDRVTEQDKANERMRQMPFHMHINVDLLDGVYLVCAMLLEVPNLAMFDDKRHTISKQFRRYLDAFQRQIFSGPPENTRDYVLAATQALSAGEWKLCVQHVFALKMWSVMPHREHVRYSIRDSLFFQLKTTC
jgi:translation initiation factor 3 subunit C